MKLFNKRPKTMNEVFERAIEESHRIQEDNQNEADKLAQEQKIRAEKLEAERKAIEDKFKQESEENKVLQTFAQKEAADASSVIDNFAQLFNRSA